VSGSKAGSTTAGGMAGVADGGGAVGRCGAGTLAGALLFGFSDFLIGIHRFHQPLPGAAFAIILTYWAGQALFAVTAIKRSMQAAGIGQKA